MHTSVCQKKRQNFLKQNTGQIIKRVFSQRAVCGGTVRLILIFFALAGAFLIAGTNSTALNRVGSLKASLANGIYPTVLHKIEKYPSQSSEFVFVGLGGPVGADILFEENGDPAMVQGDSFISFHPPIVLHEEETGARQEIIEYVVQRGETVSETAQFFGVSIKTILWANNLSYRSIIKVGQTLLIPPVNGTLHTVKKGDTCGTIAKHYKAEVQKILNFNKLGESCNLFVGEVLIIPGGVMPPPPPRIYKPTHFANTSSGFFVFPTTGRISQGLHPVNAVDISHKCGTQIHAAASGTVVDVALTNSASQNINQGYGNFVKILHENGIATLYAHLKSAFVREGDTLSRGDVIASMGGLPWMPGSGRSTGCHLHFEVRGAKNPFAR